MPYKLSDSAKGCSGWAVVNSATGRVVGCHPTKAKAQKHLAALYANVPDASSTPRGASVEMAVDNSSWDGNRAMTQCSSAADYSKVCAGTKAGDPALRSSHALPHHYLAQAPTPNAAGTRAALQRFSQTQGLTNAGEARRHLEAHMASIEAAQASAAIPATDLFRAIYPGVEVREETTGHPEMVGHFARFNEWAEIDSIFEGRFLERVAPGAFADSFAALTPKPLFQHGMDPELGDKVLGAPVEVREDDEGAAYRVPLFPSVPPLIVDGLRAGAYGASFRFSVEDEEVDRRPKLSDHNPEGLPERTITRAKVAEFGPVTFPAYAGATAGIRSMTDAFRPPTIDDELERLVVEHPNELARRIAQLLPKQEKPREDTPAPKRFRTREDWNEWLSTKT